MSTRLVGVASLLGIGVLFGLSGVIGKYLSEHLNAYQVVEYRFFVALAACILFLLATRTPLTFGKIDSKTLVLFSITFPISVILFYLAIYHTTVSLAVFSFYAATLVSSFIIGRLYFDEKITTHKKIALLLVLVAVILFTNPLNGFSIGTGFVFGVLAGIVQTIASSYQKIVSGTTSRIGLLTIQAVAGTVISLIAVLFSGASIFSAIPPFAIGAAILFGLSLLIISYLFLIGFKYIALNTGSILVSTELFFGPFFAFILLSESMSAEQILGGALLLGAVYFANK